jgi:hypothetical protein
MSIFIPGTSCVICGQPINEGDKRKGFPAFVANEKDPLHIFSDANVHDACFVSHPLASEAEARLHQVQDSFKTENRISYISGKSITSPDDYLGLGFLTADKDDPLYELNLKHLGRAEIATWDRKQWLISELRRLQESGKWKGKALAWLIDELNKIHG